MARSLEFIGAQVNSAAEVVTAHPPGDGERDPLFSAIEPDRFPCSLGQRRFWILDQLDPGNPSLNVAVRWRLEGTVSIEQLEHALELILARHAVLRTGIVAIDGSPMQVV